jgi:hypothetical protein
MGKWITHSFFFGGGGEEAATTIEGQTPQCTMLMGFNYAMPTISLEGGGGHNLRADPNIQSD